MDYQKMPFRSTNFITLHGLIYIYLDCVRRLSWSATALDTLLIIYSRGKGCLVWVCPSLSKGTKGLNILKIDWLSWKTANITNIYAAKFLLFNFLKLWISFTLHILDFPLWYTGLCAKNRKRCIIYGSPACSYLPKFICFGHSKV